MIRKALDPIEKILAWVLVLMFATVVVVSGEAANSDFDPAVTSTGRWVTRLVIPEKVAVRLVSATWKVEAGKDVLDVMLSSTVSHPGAIFISINETVESPPGSGSMLTCSKALAWWRAPKGYVGRTVMRFYGLNKVSHYTVWMAASDRAWSAGESLVTQ